jgi:hypothetical protein
LALVITLLVAVVLQRGRGPGWLLGAACLPVPVVALFSRQFNIVGWHAFMHASPIYQIMARGGAPEDPLYAGGALRYPWAEFWLTASAARLTGWNPLALALVGQVIAFLIFLAAAAGLASALTDDRLTIGLAVFAVRPSASRSSTPAPSLRRSNARSRHSGSRRASYRSTSFSA